MGGGCKASLLTASCLHLAQELIVTFDSITERASRVVEGVFLAFHLRLVGGGLTSAAAALRLNMNSCTVINFASQHIDFSRIRT
jgi:hypothetical protein